MTRLRAPRATALLAAAGVLGAGVIVVAPGSGSTYGLWHDEARLSTGTLVASTLGLSVTGLDALATTYTADADAVVARVVVTNTATGAARIDSLAAVVARAGDEDLAGAVTVAIWPATGDTCPTTPPAGATDWTGWLAGTALAPGASVASCVRTAVDPAALAGLDGQSLTTTVTVTGTTGGWTTAASGAFTQSVDAPTPEPSLPPVTSPSCSQNGGKGLYYVDFDFSAAVPADGTRYRVYLDDQLLSQDVYGTWAHVGLNSGDVASALPGLAANTVTQHVLTVRLYAAPQTVVAQFAIWVLAMPDGAGVTLQCSP